MALWQFTFRIVPKQALIAAYGKMPIKVSYDEFRELPTWDISNNKNALFHLLDTNFTRSAFQRHNFATWGNPDETNFILFFDGINVDFKIRLDLRSLEQKTLRTIEEIGDLLDAVIVTELGSVIDSKSGNLIKEIKASKAFKFVKDPSGFFNK